MVKLTRTKVTKKQSTTKPVSKKQSAKTAKVNGVKAAAAKKELEAKTVVRKEKPILATKAPSKLRLSAIQRKHKSSPTLLPLPTINQTDCEVFAFGTGDMCELGLGPEKASTVKRPRLSPYLSKEIVDIAVGGQHGLVLDSQGRVWSWGGNDLGALGRDTSGHEVLKDMDADESDDEDDPKLNPAESIPALVDTEQRFVKIEASDSLSLALTAEGDVWAWGSFRNSQGTMGFSDKVKIQDRPAKIEELSNVAAIAAGRDHVLALTQWGTVHTWGDAENFRLGWKSNRSTLSPRELGLKNIVAVGAGEFHSFAIDTSGRVLAWGLNQFGQCGILGQSDNAAIDGPTYVDALDGKKIISVTGGEHHSLALSEDGTVYSFGRYDYHQIGFTSKDLPEGTVRDDKGNPRFLPVPSPLSLGGEDDDEKLPNMRFIACGAHHSLIIDVDGRVWTWGFSSSFQTGHAEEDDVETPRKIMNTAIKPIDVKMAGGGGQFSVVAGVRKQE
ncbi:Protein pim1 [Yarrowia sp. C11]|nr:Protein pim1 [Yarrowia sp. E02]KAG5369672.1 Protein pim1 [Yarrowia sp. C11]